MKPRKKILATILSVLLSGGLVATAQPAVIQVNGTVLDSGGSTLVGAAVEVEGTRTFALTDSDGKFSLKAPSGSSLKVSLLGFVTQKVAAQKEVRIVLTEDVQQLEETVVIGYGVQRKSDVTGAIASLKSSDLENRTISNLAQSLAGKTSGVQVINTTGRPGSSGSIRVRGYSSNSGAISPLYIVDGIQVGDIGYLDPSNIESMEVLKDAASAAIYGAQAGNGVILVTTKSGAKEGEGKIFYDMQYSIESIGHVPEMMQAQDYINYMVEGGKLSLEDLKTYYDGHTNTNWMNETFENGVYQKHTVGFMGGGKRGNLYVAGSWLDNDGVVKGDKDFYKRLTSQVNADYQVKPWLKIGLTNSIEKYSYGSVSESNYYGSVLGSAIIMDPLTPAYYTEEQLPLGMKLALSNGYNLLKNKDGLYYSVSDFIGGEDAHPLVQTETYEAKNEGMNVLGSFFADFTPVKGLVFSSKFGYRLGYSNSSNYSFPYFINTQKYSTKYGLSGTVSNNLSYQWDNYVNYMFNIKEHNFTAMAGMSFMHGSSNYITGSGDELKSYEKNFRYLSFLTTECNDSVSGIESESSSLSYFGRLGWSWKNRYMLQATFRADAFDSSKLSAKNRWGYFPSVSAGWTISDEDFMKGISRNALSFLKIRGSWGANGNIGVLGGYPYTRGINVGAWSYQYDTTGGFYYGSAPAGLANPDLKWETSEQIDLGLDARFLRDKLSFSVDWYNKKTKDLLISVTPPFETGATSVTMNAGKVRNWGIETELSWKDSIGDFYYGVTSNLSMLRNKVTYLDPTVSRISGQSYHTSTVTMFETGHPVWYMYGYKFDHIDQATGNPIFEDINGDGVITGDDKTEIGCAIPDLTYGLTINLAYKGFDLTMFGSGVAGNDTWLLFYRSDYQKRNNLKLFYDDRWTETNTGASRPRSGCVDEDKYYLSSATIFDGSYFKIKQMQLGYTLPQNLTRKARIENLRLYVSMDNWFTFTKYPGFDPESASMGATAGMGIDCGAYPVTRKLVFGLNLSF